MNKNEILTRMRAVSHLAAIAISSLFPFVGGATAKAQTAKSKKAAQHRLARQLSISSADSDSVVSSAKSKATVIAYTDIKKLAKSNTKIAPIFQAIFGKLADTSSQATHYPWRKNIVTTVFWVGETPTARNPVPNSSSAWDEHWAHDYGGNDSPTRRRGYIPAAFTPHQNPFYVALPYNDISHGKLKSEAARVIPWFKEAYERPDRSVCKDRWIAIRYKGRVCYAQWEDAGPFRTDNADYVFGNARPKPNLNHGAGLDVSPAVRDYLGLDGSNVTDWRFVDFSEIQHGPWSLYGTNNTFVLNSHKEHAEHTLRE